MKFFQFSGTNYHNEIRGNSESTWKMKMSKGQPVTLYFWKYHFSWIHGEHLERVKLFLSLRPYRLGRNEQSQKSRKMRWRKKGPSQHFVRVISSIHWSRIWEAEDWDKRLKIFNKSIVQLPDTQNSPSKNFASKKNIFERSQVIREDIRLNKI